MLLICLPDRSKRLSEWLSPFTNVLTKCCSSFPHPWALQKIRGRFCFAILNTLVAEVVSGPQEDCSITFSLNQWKLRSQVKRCVFFLNVKSSKWKKSLSNIYIPWINPWMNAYIRHICWDFLNMLTGKEKVASPFCVWWSLFSTKQQFKNYF